MSSSVPQGDKSWEFRKSLRNSQINYRNGWFFVTVQAGRALNLSPQPTGSRLNKKVATWCNEYVVRHSDEIWVGGLSPNGMLRAMLEGLGRLRKWPVVS